MSSPLQVSKLIDPPSQDALPSSLTRSVDHRPCSAKNDANNFLESRRNRNRIRKRPVSFGNPALGTYHGYVFTQEQYNHEETTRASTVGNISIVRQNQLMAVNEGEDEIVVMASQRLVAMVDVPPEQVPDGILNLARSHRPWIDHLRIVIEDKCNQNDSLKFVDCIDDQTLKDTDGHIGAMKNSSWPSVAIDTDINSHPPTASAAEIAASMILLDHQFEYDGSLTNSSETELQDKERKAKGGALNFAIEEEKLNDRADVSIRNFKNNNIPRTYLALVELCSEDAAKQFVNDLHQQPYTILDENELCSVYHVVALQGEDGVSLMSPFFAATTSVPKIQPSSIMPKSDTLLTPSDVENSSTSILNTSSVGTTSKKSPPKPNTTLTTTDDHFNCAVCLERIEFDHRSGDISSVDLGGTDSRNNELDYPASRATSILTTVCNHTFHLDCLLQWQDSPCPVCRYDHSGLNDTLSQCHICGKTENNYVCLICGVVSCGDNNSTLPALERSTGTTNAAVAAGTSKAYSQINSGDVSCGSCTSLNGVSVYPTDSASSTSDQRAEPLATSNSHARKHYDETLHAYALNTDTQHVWDFAGQGYVHRLLQNKEDGKLVEVNDPHNTTSQERTLDPGLSNSQEGEVVHRKLESFAGQYYTLLKSQLEQQRIFYEGRLEEIRREYGIHDSHTGSSGTMNYTSKRKKETSDLITALKQERNQLRNRLHSMQNKLDKTKKDVAFLVSMNESLEANRIPLKQQLAQVQKSRLEQRTMFEQTILPPLQARVTGLMLELESSYATSSIQNKNCDSLAMN